VSLRSRFSLAAAGLALLVVAGFAATAYLLFVRTQEAELRRLLEQDLARVATLWERPVLGASFADPDVTGLALQFVDPDGRVVVGWGVETPLPAVGAPELRELDGRTYLVGTAPWEEGRGTIRLAHDVEAALAARAELARSLLVAGVLTFLVAALGAVVATRRALRPLARVAQQARAVDATEPGAIAYDGPEDEIGDLATALNETLAAIRARHEQERSFLREVAHELAAPLTLVSYHLTSLERDGPDEERLRAASDAAQELLRTSQDLLVLARGELDRPLAFEILDLRGPVARVAREYPGLRTRADEPAETVGDPDRLVQVLRNLVRNGVRAAGAAEGVEVRLEPGDAQHLVTVDDRGPGMGSETLQHAFEPGFGRAGGVGVGLTIARSLVERHGGSLTAGPSVAGGSRFEARLPSLAARLDGSSDDGPRSADADDAGRSGSASGATEP
jgi:signal transduction histidine kinase